MNAILSIRRRLGCTQSELAQALGCTQGNVHHYERGQTVLPAVARRLIAFAAQRGEVVTFDDIYAAEPMPATGSSVEPAAAEVQTSRAAA
jgi:putative transcriptional regulator